MVTRSSTPKNSNTNKQAAKK